MPTQIYFNRQTKKSFAAFYPDLFTLGKGLMNAKKGKLKSIGMPRNSKGFAYGKLLKKLNSTVKKKSIPELIKSKPSRRVPYKQGRFSDVIIKKNKYGDRVINTKGWDDAFDALYEKDIPDYYQHNWG